MQFTLDLDQKDSRTELYFGWLIEAKKFERSVTEAGEASPGQRKIQGISYWKATSTGLYWETWIANQRTSERYKIQSAESYIREPEVAIKVTKDFIDTFYTVEFCGKRISRVEQFSPNDPADCELEPVCSTRNSPLSGEYKIWYVALVKGQREAITIESVKSEEEAWETIKEMEQNGWTY